MHQLTITVDDTLYQTLKPMVEQETLGSFLHDFMQNHQKKNASSITTLRGTLHKVDTSDLRDESDRSI